MRKLIPLLCLGLLFGCQVRQQAGMTATQEPVSHMSFMRTTVSGDLDSNWQQVSHTDALRQKTTTALVVESDNTVKLKKPYGPTASARLVVANTADGYPKVILTVSDGQIVCDNCSVVARFDDGSPKRYSARTLDHLRKTVIFAHDGFLADLVKSKSLFIELDFYPDGFKQFTFQVEGLTRSVR